MNKITEWIFKFEGSVQPEIQLTLINIAKSDHSWRARRAATERITDQTVLVEIAKNDEDCDVRRAAIERLKFLK